MEMNVEKLMDIIVYDVFSPPVASRIYSYAALAQYETIRFNDTTFHSFRPKLNGFDPLPQPDSLKKYNFTIAAVSAFSTIALKVIFNKDSLRNYIDYALEILRKDTHNEIYKRSLIFGEKIGNTIWKRVAKDFYKETRGMAKYNVQRIEGKWQPTTPDYPDATEPWWNKIRPLVLDKCDQCKPPAPFYYDTSKNSLFFKDAIKLFNLSAELNDSLKNIATFWDDNPFVMDHKGHASFDTKKMTPGGHKIEIAAIACRTNHSNEVKTAEAFALTSIAISDGFISCWDEKYRSETVRPITFINKYINADWQPFLQTPPFPEYPSGHSVISSSAAVVLTHLFGNNFNFEDSSDFKYQGMVRNFSSFYEAADEAGISRFYGGIHFMNAINQVSAQGKKVGKVVLQKLILTNNVPKL